MISGHHFSMSTKGVAIIVEIAEFTVIVMILVSKKDNINAVK